MIILNTFLATVRDVALIGILLLFFQLIVLAERVPYLKRVIIGFLYVVCGLALFLIGLDQALFPVGEIMAQQLTDPDFIRGENVAIETSAVEASA